MPSSTSYVERYLIITYAQFDLIRGTSRMPSSISYVERYVCPVRPHTWNVTYAQFDLIRGLGLIIEILGDVIIPVDFIMITPPPDSTPWIG